MSDDTEDAGSPLPQGAQRTDPAALAKRGDGTRAGLGARTRRSPDVAAERAQRQKKSRRAATDGESSPQPFGAGRDPRAMSENVDVVPEANGLDRAHRGGLRDGAVARGHRRPNCGSL